jgi:hypothetical protein
MFAEQILFRKFTNREDFIETLKLTDRDSYDGTQPFGQRYQPIDLAQVTLPGGQNFTASHWTVQIGALTTSSTSTLTIPAYPIGSQLLALALTVPPNLAIVAGQPITITDQSGVNSMTGFVTGYTAASGALVCQIGWSFQFEIRIAPPISGTMGYVPWYDLGVYPDYGPLISASLGNGINILDLGMIQISVPEAKFKTLGNIGVANQPTDWGGTFRANLTMTNTQDTRQVFMARLPVMSGGVTV